MRILIATHQLSIGAGTETYTRTLARALRERDHEVFVYSPFLGEVAREIAATGIPVSSDLQAWHHEFFSVAHVHHNVVATQVRATFPDVPIVWLRHGVIPELERPPDFTPEVTLAVAPERAGAAGDDGKTIAIVANPIDTDHFAPRRPIRAIPKTALVLTNHLSSTAWTAITEASQKLGVDVRHVGHPNNVADVRGAIDAADVVFAVGRSALEAGAMARAVLIHDHHGCDGWLDRANYHAAAEYAFSGHRSWHLPTGPELAELIAREYSPEKGQEARALVVEHHALDVVIPQLESHYRSAIERGRNRKPQPIPATVAEQLASYQRDIRTLQEDLQTARAAVTELRSELDSVYASKSWRWATPLRRAKKLIARRRA